jgi:hypothetical protein
VDHGEVEVIQIDDVPMLMVGKNLVGRRGPGAGKPATGHMTIGSQKQGGLSAGGTESRDRMYHGEFLSHLKI